VGGGPAGLTAAIYLARFHMNIRIVDAGHGRTAQIPVIRNLAGFPGGITGKDLLNRMQDQARRHGCTLDTGRVTGLTRQENGFHVETANTAFDSRTVLIATGVVNRRPTGIDEGRHAQAVARGLIRYCPICDGYEVTDRPVAVLGTGERGYKEALFLRGFTARLSLIAPDGPHALTADQRGSLESAGICLTDGPPLGFDFMEDAILIALPSGEERFASVYPALGSDSRSELAKSLGASVSSDGCLLVDAHQRTDIAGLYAAGDVVLGLDQISHAMGEGGVAATTIRNDLAARAPLRR